MRPVNLSRYLAGARRRISRLRNSGHRAVATEMEQRDRGFRAAVASVETIADELQATLGDQLAALAEQQRALAATVAEQGELLSRLEQQLAALERRDDPAH